MRKDYVAAILAGAVAGGALAALGIYGAGQYGWTLFFGVPLGIGFVSAAALRLGGRRPLSDSILCTLGASLLLSFGFLFLGKEGAICIILAIPLAAPFLAIGALLGYLSLHRGPNRPVTSATALLAILGAALCAEPRVHDAPPLDIVQDSVVVHASTEEVWTAVVGLDEVPTPAGWMYRAGLACPQRTRIESARAGGRRVCTLSTGQLVEHIEVWRPGRTLRWHSQSTPPPMKEMNPFCDHVDAPHLHGFYESPRGEFALERISPNLTLLTRRTWYSQRLYPNAYWGFLCEHAISQIHRTVLGHVRDIAERRIRI